MPLSPQTRIALRALRFEVRERLLDLALLAWPIFATTGLLALAVTFWAWLLGWSL